jgi:hypothetical protein
VACLKIKIKKNRKNKKSKFINRLCDLLIHCAQQSRGLPEKKMKKIEGKRRKEKNL